MAFVFPEVVPGDPLRISASTFQTWKRCPASAEARFAGLFEPYSRVSFSGSLAHLIFKRHLEDGPIADEEFSTICRQEIGKSESLNYKLAEAGLGRMSALSPLFEEVRDLYHRFVRLPLTGFAGSEVELDHEVASSNLTLLGKIEFEMGEEGRERAVLEHLLRMATATVFRQRLSGLDLSGFTSVFADGAMVETGELVPAGELLAQVGTVPGLSKVLDRLGYGDDATRGQLAAAVEFTLEGLHLTRRLEKEIVNGRTVYGAA